MIPLVLAGLGVAALALAAGLLRSFGTRYRVGRLLAAIPRVPIADAIALARRGEPRYIRVDGRIDAADEFEDADHRPLVLRRTRLQARNGRAWTTFEDGREVVRFEVREGLDAIGVDGDALGDGLVVVPRESIGTAADLGDRSPAGLASDTPVRALIEQVSSVEHAAVLGVPVLDDGGAPQLTAGLGRPLILTTLEQAEAMRILTHGGAGRARLAALSFVIGIGLLAAAVVAWLADAAGALAASPSPPAGGGDPRSSGEGPGLVGDPLFAVLVVVLIAIAAIVATTVWVRLTRPPG
ncbi:MAG TPA: hypothetical protein VFR14_03420 [Candidatus Limnocylindrales bacterium]|nr:hypothetical protein [Candidatus Limnocylindrales bacterium]